eukprot:TRINITY_DN6810_c0_g1_i1.p2 TRINITY_DN6810_c0_g1~~TRINITY_DN6810_c0_g1_i1.p2  ORF type:complete len:116 (-),score=8.08 TRINITY_DN6810_c0_g1_i1:122-469(-)
MNMAEQPYKPNIVKQRAVYSAERKSAMIAFWNKHRWNNCEDRELKEFCSTYGVTKQQMKCFRGNHKSKYGPQRGVKRKRLTTQLEQEFIPKFQEISAPFELPPSMVGDGDDNFLS